MSETANRIDLLEAEVRKYRVLFIATAMKYALARDTLDPDPEFCEKVANVALPNRKDWVDLFGVEAHLHKTICVELDKLYDQVKEPQNG